MTLTTAVTVLALVIAITGLAIILALTQIVRAVQDISTAIYVHTARAVDLKDE